MYISSRTAQFRNLSIAIINGTITLVILLIAPLGLAAVIINTALVTLTTYLTASIGDRVVRYLQADTPLRAELVDRPGSLGSMIQRQSVDELEQR